jgi:hypothetical protein
MVRCGFSPQRPGFVPGSVHVGFVVGKVALGQNFSEFFSFFLSISLHNGSPHSYIIWRINNRPVKRQQFRDIASPHQHEQHC